MNIPINPFMWIMAFLPIVVLLVLMIKFQWGATEAAPIGLLITVFTGIVFYKADVKLLASESAKGIWNAFVILLIVWTAILLYQVADEAKAFQAIRNGMSKLLPNELLLVLAMGWIFESFLQGITGFGVPVAVGAPLPIGIGVTPLWAVIIPLFGQAWGNTFGTLGAAWDSLAMSTGLLSGSSTYLATALWAGIFIWIWDFITGISICWFYGKGKAVKKGFLAVLVMSLIQGGGQLLLSQINTTISCFVPSCVSLIALLLIGRTKWYKDKWQLTDSSIMDRKDSDPAAGESGAEKSGTGKNGTGENSTEKNNTGELAVGMTLVQAFVPYVILTVIALVVLLVTPINTALSKISIGLSFPETSTGYGIVNKAEECFSPLVPFTHASMFLFVAAIVGLFYFQKHGWIKTGGAGRVFKKSVAMTIPSGIAVIGLIIMSKIMGGTGQTVVLAEGIAAVLGKWYAVLAPIVGMIGSFMTGSNMSSNILFGDFQMTTANLLHLNTSAVLGAQTAGGAIGSAISPSKIVLGTTTANILGREGEVLKKILPVTFATSLFIGIILFLTVVIG